MQVFAIVPAAGLGTRMAGPQPKQFLALDGVPILIHSLRAFAAAPRVTAIYVAVRKQEMERAEAQVTEYGFAGRVHVVEGGEKRQESVANALKHGRATQITIACNTAGSLHKLTILDNGVGIGTQPKAGMGLRIMRYRAALIGAELTFSAAERRGTLVSCAFTNTGNHDE